MLQNARFSTHTREDLRQLEESLPGVWHKSLSVRCSLPRAKKPVTALLNKAYSHATKIEATVYAAVLDDDADVVPFCSREFIPAAVH